MARDVNFIKIGSVKLPKSPMTWLFIALCFFLAFLILGKPITATVIFLLLIGVISFIININLRNPYPALWAVCVGCLLLALLLGIAFVSSEWQWQAVLPISVPPSANTTPAR